MGREENGLKKQTVYDRIKQMIMDNELPAGMPLVERTLSNELNVSRTPIREALRKLSNEGMVEIKEGKGVYVAELHFEDVIEIFELRESLECLATKLCVQRRTEAMVNRLTEYLNEQEKAYQNEAHGEFMHIDMLMHNYIAESSKNKRLAVMISSIYDQVARMAISVQEDSVIRDIAITEHRKLIQAIREGKVDEAVEVMCCHIASVKQYHIDKYYLL